MYSSESEFECEGEDERRGEGDRREGGEGPGEQTCGGEEAEEERLQVIFLIYSVDYQDRMNAGGLIVAGRYLLVIIRLGCGQWSSATTN